MIRSAAVRRLAGATALLALLGMPRGHVWCAEPSEPGSELSVSADGRFAAFSSGRSNWVPDDTNQAVDVFVEDRQTGAVERMSVSSSGAQANHHSFAPVISSNGRFVAFGSLASNLVEGDANEFSDVFVHDRETGTTERVSITSTGGEADQASFAGSISNDGRFVVFRSLASNLLGAEDDGSLGALASFVHDRRTGVTRSSGSRTADEIAARAEQMPPGPAAREDGFVPVLSAAVKPISAEGDELIAVSIGPRSASPTPAQISLRAESDARPVGSEHCVTASVTDANGGPLPGVPVDFVVSGTDQNRMSLETAEDGSGPTFCYRVSDLAGSDTIRATARGGSAAAAEITLAVLPLPSSARCKVEYFGRLRTGGGHPAQLSGFASARNGSPAGHQVYRDLGLQTGLDIEMLVTDALACDGHSATLFGRAKGPDGSELQYRVDVVEGVVRKRVRARPGHFRIRLSDGYDSGDQSLTSGFVQVDD